MEFLIVNSKDSEREYSTSRQGKTVICCRPLSPLKLLVKPRLQGRVLTLSDGGGYAFLDLVVVTMDCQRRKGRACPRFHGDLFNEKVHGSRQPQHGNGQKHCVLK